MLNQKKKFRTPKIDFEKILLYFLMLTLFHGQGGMNKVVRQLISENVICKLKTVSLCRLNLSYRHNLFMM